MLNKERYKFKIYKNIFGIDKPIEGNSKIKMLDDSRIRCATRHGFETLKMDEAINKVCLKINDLWIIENLIYSRSLRFGGFLTINLIAFRIQLLLNNNINCILTSLLMTLPLTTYLSIEDYHFEHNLEDDRKYDIMHNMEDIYQNVINYFCMLIYKLNITDPVDIMILFDEAVCKSPFLKELVNYHKSNYFFTENELMQKREDLIMESYENMPNRMYGYNVLFGYAVCRHKASMFNEILKRLGYKSSLVSLKCANEHTFHEIVMLEKDNVCVYLDPTNLVTLKIENDIFIDGDGYRYEKISKLKNLKFKRVGFDTKYKMNKPVSYLSDVEERRKMLLLDSTISSYVELFKKETYKFYEDFNDLYGQLSYINRY